jgi:hypothetical protein
MFEDGERGIGKHVSGTCGGIPQIIGNIRGNVEVPDMSKILKIKNLIPVNVYAIIIVLCISIDKSIIRTRSLRNTHSQETQHLSWETL